MDSVVDATTALSPICFTDLTHTVWAECASLLPWRSRGQVRGVYMYVCLGVCIHAFT